MATIKWNNAVKLILADVDETIADLYMKAEPEMCEELIKLLNKNTVIFFVTGQGLKSVQSRIIDFIPQQLRKNILIGHCSGAEVWGHDSYGNLNAKPFYSVYEETVSENQKVQWRNIVKQLVEEFELKTCSPIPVKEFMDKTMGDPLAIMLEDRGPQITFEVINGYDLTPEQISKLTIDIPQTHGSYDLRIPILERADQLFREHDLPITSRLGGVFAVDFAVKGISKTTAVKYVLSNDTILSTVGLHSDDLCDPLRIEVWGDKFSKLKGGTDRHMSEAVSPEVRSIDFREENPLEFEKGYNIVVWDGEKHLHEGTLEYLQSRDK